LVLAGGLSAGAVTSCGPANKTGPISANNVYTNNQYIPGVGYYHAPFRAWYGQPYNHFDPQGQRYFYGGQWGSAPHESFTNISGPTPDVARAAQAQRTDTSRGGFGGTSRSWSTYS
jgi:hypothetical protein